MSFLKDIKQIIGRNSALSSDILFQLAKKYPGRSISSLKTALSRHLSKGDLFSSSPLTFKNGEYAISYGRTHNFEKYLPLIKRELPELYFVIDTIQSGCGYMSIFNIKKILAIENYQIDKYKNILKKLINNLCFNKNYFYVKSQNENDEQSLYEKNRDRLLYTLISRHEKQNLIFAHSIYYKTKDYMDLSLANLSFDAYSKSTALQANDAQSVYLLYDFAINGNYSLPEAIAYSKRIAKLAKKTGAKIVPLSIFNEAADEVVSFLKTKGIILIDFKSILGPKTNQILKKISQLDMGKYKCELFNYILKYLSEFDQFDSIKGGLFEHLCFAILNKYKTNPNTIMQTNYLLRKENNKKIEAQYDIYLKTFDEETIICECKAYKTKMYIGKNTPGTFSYFLKQFEKYKTKNENEKVSYIVFSANGFSSKIMDMNPKNNESLEFSNISSLVNYERANKYTHASDYVKIWKKYFLEDEKKDN